MARKKLYLEQRVKGMDKMSEAELVEARTSGAPWPMEYRVTKVVGNTTPRVNEILQTETAQAFCEDEDWEVTIT